MLENFQFEALKLDGSATETLTYEKYIAESLNKVVFRSNHHTLQDRDLCELFRSFPKKNGLFPGMAKSTAKFTLDSTIPNTAGEEMSAPVIVTVKCSVPLGTSPAVTDAMRSRLAAFVATDVFKDLADELAF